MNDVGAHPIIDCVALNPTVKAGVTRTGALGASERWTWRTTRMVPVSNTRSRSHSSTVTLRRDTITPARIGQVWLAVSGWDEMQRVHSSAPGPTHEEHVEWHTPHAPVVMFLYCFGPHPSQVAEAGTNEKANKESSPQVEHTWAPEVQFLQGGAHGAHTPETW